MTEVTSILSGSDNLWKYLFTVGVLLIGLSILYPLKQSHLIDLQVIELKTDSKSLKQKVNHLKEDNNAFNVYLSIANLEIDSLKAIKNLSSASSRVLLIESEIAKERKVIRSRIRELQLLVIENQGKEDIIRELREQSSDYRKYFYVGLTFGTVILILGLYKWCMATIASDKLRWKELGESERKVVKEIFQSIKFRRFP